MPKVKSIKDAVSIMLSAEKRAIAAEDYDEVKLFRLEADLQAFMLAEKFKLLEAMGLCMCVKHSDRMISGLPDLQVFVGEGEVIFIELKRSGEETPRPEQLRFHHKIEQFGCDVYVAYTWGMVKSILHKHGVPVYRVFPSTKGVELGECKEKERR